MPHCEVCSLYQHSLWPVDVNALTGGPQKIRMLCDGCAAIDGDAAWMLEKLQAEPRDERQYEGKKRRN